mmetsp:Transcript_54280/g.137926  ORF Transcript_54280/g.137926 Transcript_54280/m.137926 type:complete len:82 (-) Transcript_54280:250-495(-)
MPQLIGPRAAISFFIAAWPRMKPYSEMVAFGYLVRPTQVPPHWGKESHDFAMLIAEHDQSTNLQMPEEESDEQAMYGCEVS